jgi:hypothetical protein
MKKKLLIGFLVFIIVTVLGSLLLLWTGKNSFKKSDQFELTMQHILKNDSIRFVLGEAFAIEDFGGAIYSDSARIAVELTGNSKALIVNCGLIKKGNQWEIVDFEVLKSPLVGR